VGQGDGILIRTPNHRHIMIDGGYQRSKQPTGKNAADFVDWKFAKDYGTTTIDLDVMIASHCDADHYGGLWDLLNPAEDRELDAQQVLLGHFLHAGVSWFKKPGGRYLGPESNGFLTRLLGNRADVGAALGSGSGIKLQGEWAKFLQCVYDTGCPISRISHVDAWLPGFAPGEQPVAIRVLAPVEYDLNGQPALTDFGSDSKNTNGHSVLLRLDYGRSRILLTGDLNKKAQQSLLTEWEGSRTEFLCDVAKGCHHGSDDVSYAFLQAMQPAATVISSGDDESHSHPRPKIVAASGLTGYVTLANDEIVTPLVYSTEIARSVRIGTPKRFTFSEVKDAQGQAISETRMDKVGVDYGVVTAGALKPQSRTATMNHRKIVDGIIYGLVNVRTDGDRILCATLNEADSKWEIESFSSRF
ncbi:MAG: hypothetical protein KC729_13305, partial [Candidatus Eisenbacteria bacterium]|nr:hypothetical protein [Candidatus Eisenbacteria bacterium]